MFKTRGGVKGRLNNVKKNCTICLNVGFSYHRRLNPTHALYHHHDRPHVWVWSLVM